jgi:biotin carboxylase
MPDIRNVVFVAPFFQETTLRLLHGVAALPDTRVGLVSQDAASRVPEETRALLTAYHQVTRGLDTAELGRAVSALRDEFGSVDRLIGALEELQVPLGEIRDDLGIPGMGGEASKNFRDKARMKDVLRANGLPCARHLLAESPDQAREFAKQIGFPLVGKPPAGSGARSTYRFETEDQLNSMLHSVPPDVKRPMLLEEFVTGTESSFDSVSLNGETVWHSISHYQPTPLEVLTEPWIQWTVTIPREVDHPDYAPIMTAGARAVKVLGLKNGLSHMEWFKRPDGSIAISEVGARPPGAQIIKLISYAHDFDLYHAWGRLMVYEDFEPRPRPFAAGAAYLRGQGSGEVASVTGIEDVFAEHADIIMEHRIPQPGQSGTSSYEGEGYVIVRHPDTEVVHRALRSIIEKVRVILK